MTAPIHPSRRFKEMIVKRFSVRMHMFVILTAVITFGLVLDRVLGPGGPQVERLDVVGEHVLEEWNGAGPPDDEPAHVRNVEEPRALARGQVFLHDPGRVLERHFPTAKIHHLGPEGLVPVV